MPAPAHSVFRFEGYVLDMTRGCLSHREGEVHLRPKSFDLLCHLVLNANRLVSKEEILKAVWPNVFVTNDSLTQCVREVRAALDDQGQRLIKTVPRRGYLFAATVTGPEDQLLIVEAIPSTMARLSIAVLPFLSLSEDADQEHLADGLTDSLTTDLSRIPGSLVIARSSAFTYKGKHVEARKVGRELGVRYLLEGSVQRDGHRIRVNAQLIDARTGMHLWAERYDRSIGDLLAVQDEITCRIALSLDVALPEFESRRTLRERPTDCDAASLIMRAWSIWNRKVTPDTIAQALSLFEGALRIDPKSDAALLGVARMNIAQVLNHSSVNRERNIQVAEEAVTRVLDVDPRNALAHLTRGLVLRTQGKLDASVAAFRKAVELNPNEVRAYVAIGESEYLLGRAEEAIGALEHALRLDPREHRTNIFAMLGWCHLLLGREDEAVNWFLRSIHHNPGARRSHLWLACAYALKGMEQEARIEIETFNRMMPGYTLSRNSAVDASDNPVFVRQRERLYTALRKLGVPD
jgi:TolB-like protein/Tfp pilus assembly protein PilF